MSDGAKSVFRKLVNVTHPDKGGDAAQFRAVIKVKHNFDALVNLANRWGIVIKDIPSGTSYEDLEAVIGVIIEHVFTYKKKTEVLHGVIVNTRKITKGYRKGATEFKIFDLNSGQIWTLKTFEKQPFSKLVALADISQINEGQEKIKSMKKFDKMKKQVKQTNADNHFDRIGLVKNKSYNGQNIQVLVEYKGGKHVWEKLTRTTPKSVYISHYGYKNDERRIAISNVLRKQKSPSYY